MKKKVMKLLATLLAMTLVVTDALPAVAAESKSVPSTPIVATSTKPSVDMSALSEKALAFLAEFTASEEVESAFGKTIEGYNTEALKDAIWEAIFIKRDSDLINLGSLGISQETVEKLTQEVLAEANAEGAVTYSVRKDREGNATVMQVQIDPMYEAAYDEIEAATAKTTANDSKQAKTLNSSADDEIVVAEEGEGTEGSEGTEDSEEATMEDAIAAFNQYQQFIDENPDYFGITVPYTSVKDDENEGGGPITSLITIANGPVDTNNDGVLDASDDMNGDGEPETMLWMFQNGFLPASSVLQIIQMFDTGNQLAVNLLGEELLATKDAALAAVPEEATDAQKLLVLNDWMADIATFDMASIMELEAPEPVVSDFYNQVVYVLTQQMGDEEAAQQFAAQLMGLWGGNQFGVLCPSMNNTGVCMSYTYAYAYLVQWVFDDVYKNEDGSWKTRVELNYIPNPEKQVTEEVAIVSETVAEGEEGEVVEHTHSYAAPTDADWTWEDDNSEATVTVKCTVDGCEEVYTATVAATPETTKAATCEEAGQVTYTTAAVVIGETEYTTTKVVDTEKAAHTYVDGTCSVCGAADPSAEEEHQYDDPPVFTWADNYKSATVTFTCSDCGETFTDDASITIDTSKKATCTEDGATLYIAEYTYEGIKYTETKTTTIPATGHTATAEPTWSWADDYSAATATYTCTKCNETFDVAATITSETTADCTNAGQTTYTATVEVRDTADVDTKTVDTDALGHSYGEDGDCTLCGYNPVDDLPDYVWDPSAAAMVDYVRISFDTEVTMYGEDQGNFDSDHYWNAVKVDGEWYYVDPCYTDIYIECMIRDRVETDGNMNHLYFMFSDTSARDLYEGNYSAIDTLYENIATDQTYEDAWFAFAKSPVYKSGDKYYYFYDSTDLIDMMGQMDSMESQSDDGVSTAAEDDSSSMFSQEDDFRLVYYQGTTSDGTDYTQTLINFIEGTVYSEADGTAKMVSNDLIKTLYAEHEAYKEKYPSVEISCDMEGSRLYFNIANCVLYYDVDTYEVVKVFEYNEVTADRDLSKGLGGAAFTVVDPEAAEAQAEEEAATEELTTLTVNNNPIASMTIKDGQMYISIGTTIAFISGKQSMSEEDTSIGYQFEETNYNPDYSSYEQSAGYGSEETNDNDEFMWSANFVDVIDMEHLTAGEHTYAEVSVAATCGENAYTENRCTTCGAIEAGSRVEVEGTALDHHYVKFDEQYYTKDGNAWNTGTSYVCTGCKDAKDEIEDGDHLGHEYEGVVEWSEDHTAATFDLTCGRCINANYDCVVSDDTVVIEDVEAEVTTEKESVTDEETGKTNIITTYTATATYKGDEYTATYEETAESTSPFPDVTESDYFYEPVLWAVDKEITSGLSDGTFGPHIACTRSEVVTFLWRNAGCPEPTSTENPFSDVAEGTYYYDAVLWAVENGITQGYADGTFQPSSECTRAQIVTFIWRYAGEPEPTSTENKFSDINEELYYYEAVLWAAEQGITSGYSDGTFRPAVECTRAEVVTFLYRGFAE